MRIIHYFQNKYRKTSIVHVVGDHPYPKPVWDFFLMSLSLKITLSWYHCWHRISKCICMFLCPWYSTASMWGTFHIGYSPVLCEVCSFGNLPRCYESVFFSTHRKPFARYNSAWLTRLKVVVDIPSTYQT